MLKKSPVTAQGYLEPAVVCFVPATVTSARPSGGITACLLLPVYHRLGGVVAGLGVEWVVVGGGCSDKFRARTRQSRCAPSMQ